MGNRYREMEVMTSSPGALVVRLYEGALGHCTAAEGHAEQGDTRALGVSLGKALAIVDELQQALDHERGGEIARNLEALYLFVRERLLDAQLSRRRESIGEARGVLAVLHQAWAEIARNAPSGPVRA